MSSNGDNRPHDLACTCRSCTKLKLNSLGSFFDCTCNLQPGDAFYTQMTAQSTGPQTNQGLADLQSLANNPVFNQSWRGFDQSANVRKAVLQGAVPPTQYLYEVELEIDEPAPTPSRQQQQPSPYQTNHPATTYHYSAQHNFSAGLTANTSASRFMAGGQGLSTTNRASEANGRNQGNAVDDLRFDSRRAASVGHQQQLSTSRTSHATQQRARRTLTPSSPSQPSDGDDDEGME